MIEYENLAKLNQSFFDDYQSVFKSTMEGGWYILGESVKRFENEFATYCKVNHCIGLANGLDALVLALKAHDFELGKEVIVPSNTYIATILAIIQAGLTPVLVEPEIDSYNIDPIKIAESITQNTVAIIVVHLYGRCCNMDAIQELTNKHKLALIEDSAQSHGATFKGQPAGSFGLSAFSFYPTKNLGALGDAGGITTNDENLATRIRTLRNYGSKVKYYNELVGYNSRLDEVQAAFLSVKLKKLNEINAHKNRLAGLYQAGLKGDFIKPLTDSNYYHVYHIYNIRHPKRDDLKTYLQEKGVKTEIHYPVSPNKQEAMKKVIGHLEFPISEEIHKTTLSLPISYFHSENEVSKVIEIMNKF